MWQIVSIEFNFLKCGNDLFQGKTQPGFMVKLITMVIKKAEARGVQIQWIPRLQGEFKTKEKTVQKGQVQIEERYKEPYH